MAEVVGRLSEGRSDPAQLKSEDCSSPVVPNHASSMAQADPISESFPFHHSLINAIVVKGVVDPSDVVVNHDEVLRSLNSVGLYSCLADKLAAIAKTLEIPARVDWRPVKRPDADERPFLLFDLLVETYGIVVVTEGIWNFSDEKLTNLLSSANNCAKLISEFGIRNTKSYRTKAKFSALAGEAPAEDGDKTVDSAEQPSAAAVKSAIVILADALFSSARRSFQASKLRSGPCVSLSDWTVPPDSAVHDSTVSTLLAVCASAQIGCARKLAASNEVDSAPSTPRANCPNGDAVATVDTMIEMSQDVIDTIVDETPTPAIEPYVKTLDSLKATGLWKVIVEFRDFPKLVLATFQLREAIIQLSQQRHFLWISQQAALRGATNSNGSSALMDVITRCKGSSPSLASYVTGSTATSAKSSPKEKVAGPAWANSNTPASPLGSDAGSQQGLAAASSCSGFAEVNSLIAEQVDVIATVVKGLISLVGSVIKGPYEDADVQEELTAVVVLGIYISMVGRVFYEDLSALQHTLAPLMSTVRRAVKAQTAPVNSHPSSPPTDPLAQSRSNQSSASGQTLPDNSVQPLPTKFNPLISLGGLPHNKFLFNRWFDSKVLPQLFVTTPSRDSTKSAPAGSKGALPNGIPPLQMNGALNVGTGSTREAPADRYNSSLLFLLWEGLPAIQSELLSVMRSKSDSGDAAKNAPEVIEALLVKAVCEGGRLFRERLGCCFSCPQAFGVPVSGAVSVFPPPSQTSVDGFLVSNTQAGGLSPSTPRGDEVIELAQRVFEATCLRFRGEVNLSHIKATPVPTQDRVTPSLIGLDRGTTTSPQPGGRWKRFLFTRLAKLTLPDRSTQICVKMVEPLPRLICEVVHRQLFDVQPYVLAPGGPRFKSPLKVAPFTLPSTTINARSWNALDGDVLQSVAKGLATCRRLGGVVADLELDLIDSLRCGDAARAAARSNRLALDEVVSELHQLKKEVQAQTEGIVDRHTNQIKTQTNRLDQQSSEIRKINGVITTHSALLENHTQSLKKIADGSDYRKDLDAMRISIVAQQTDSHKSLADQLSAAVKEQLRSVEVIMRKVDSDLSSVNAKYDRIRSEELAGIRSTLGELKVKQDALMKAQESLEAAQNRQRDELLSNLATDMRKGLGDVTAAQSALEVDIAEGRQRREELGALVSEEINKMTGISEAVEKLQGELASMGVNNLVTQSREAELSTSIDSINADVEQVRESIGSLNQRVTEVFSGLEEGLIERTRSELSRYLTEHLSRVVSNHISFHFDRHLQTALAQAHQPSPQQQRRRLLPWGASANRVKAAATPAANGATPERRGNNDTSSTAHTTPGGDDSIAAPKMFLSQNANSDDIDDVADSVYVMDEKEEAMSIVPQTAGKQAFPFDESRCFLNMPMPMPSFVSTGSTAQDDTGTSSPCGGSSAGEPRSCRLKRMNAGIIEEDYKEPAGGRSGFWKRAQ